MSALFVCQQRVYWDNTDGGGVVYHAQYLNLFERARTEWLRSRGIVQSALQRERGLVFAIRRMEVDWLAPARLDDLLDISVQEAAGSGVRLSFKQEMRRHSDSLLLAAASVTAVCLDFDTFKPKKMPEEIRAELTNVE
jgi:acyl-CoA thioester hydrolase